MVALPIRVQAGRFAPVALPRPALALAIGLTIWCAVALTVPDSRLAGQLPGLARYLAAELFLVAGVACLARWRLRRTPDVLHSAIGLTALGLALPALFVLMPYTPGGVHAAAGAAVMRVVLLIPIFLVLTRGQGASATRRASPLRTLVLTVAAPIATMALLAAVFGDALTSVTAQRTVAAAVEVTAGLAWALLGIRRRAYGADATRAWSSAALFLMAAGEFARSGRLAGLLTTDGTLETGLQLAAAATIVCAAATELRIAYATHGAHTDELSDALASTRRCLDDMEQVQRERLHDARSAVFGVLGACELLADNNPPSEINQVSLQQMISGELLRLQSVLDSAVCEPIEDFDLAEVLGPVVLAHRIANTPIHVDLNGLRVVGRPRVTATVVDNLLRNAHAHAPGASVTVRSHLVDDTVAVVVEDDGPGIPFSERATVLLPGVRGVDVTAPGSGLGLYTSAQAMRGQGGVLHVGGRTGGGTRITITLPAAIDHAPLVAS